MQSEKTRPSERHPCQTSSNKWSEIPLSEHMQVDTSFYCNSFQLPGTDRYFGRWLMIDGVKGRVQSAVFLSQYSMPFTQQQILSS
jgi:hypothetical protein